MKKIQISYLLARLPIGMSMFGHGAIRLTKWQRFSDGMVTEFSKSILPSWLVLPFSYALPLLELITGLLLLCGFFMRFACVLGLCLMLVLIFGSSVLEQWNNVFTQLIYGIYFAGLFRFESFNRYSADYLFRN